MKRSGLYSLVLGGVVAASLAVGFCRSDSPKIIKTYTENGREITLLDLDGNPSTAEERVTRGRFPAYGSEPPVGGYTEKKEFEPPVEKDGKKVNTEVSFYDKNRNRVEGPIRTLEPRKGRLEIPDGPEVEQSGYERMRGYLEKLDPSKFSVGAVDEQEYRGEKSFSVDFLSGSEDDENTIRVLHTKDEFSIVLIPTRVNGVYLNATISDYGNGAEQIGWFYQGVEGGNMFSAIIEGDDLVLKEIGYENDPERHCNDPFAKKDTKNNHNLLHDFDDLEVGTRLPGLGKKTREIYDAFNQKAKEAVEKQDK